MTLEEFVSHLQNPRKAGSGYSCRCPGHDDRKNSLSASQSDEKILVKCHAGCDTESILTAAGLKMSDLFATNGNGKPHDPVICRYVYTDESGKPLHRSCRTASKNFFQERYEAGAFIAGLNGARRVIYNLPAVLKATWAVICEGEKDCDNLETHGIVATTNPGGAGKWREEYSPFLKDKPVVIIPDNDEVGRKHAREVARSIFPFAKSVKLVELPDVPEKGDVSDYLRTHTKSDFIALCKAAKPLTLEDVSEQPTANPAETRAEGVSCSLEETEENEAQAVSFPEAAWVGPFAIWREITFPSTEAPAEYLWASCLVTIGLVLGRNVRYENPRPIYPNFYALLLGQTGDDRKSTALSYAEDGLFHLGLNEQVDVLSGIQSSEAIFESLARMDGGRSLAYCDEFRSLLTVAQRKGQRDIVPRLGSLYYCPRQARLDRSENSTVAVNPFLSLIAATPAEYVRDLLGDLEVDGGFLNRFLTITGPIRAWRAIAPKPSGWGPFTKSVHEICEHYDGAECIFGWSDESAEKYTDFYNKWKSSRQTWNQRDRKLTGRIDEHILKLAMVYSAINKKSIFTVDALERAILIGKWLQATTLNAYVDVGGDSFSRGERVVLDLVKAKGRMYRRYLQQWVHKNGINGEMLTRIIASLIKNGQLREGAEVTGAGQKRPWVEYVPLGPLTG
jgi:hypothetical protein